MADFKPTNFVNITGILVKKVSKFETSKNGKTIYYSIQNKTNEFVKYTQIMMIDLYNIVSIQQKYNKKILSNNIVLLSFICVWFIM